MRSVSPRSLRNKLRHYYHVWAAGRYRDAVAEHGEALRRADLGIVPEVGIVGSDAEIGEALAHLEAHLPGFRLALTEETGFEQVTLAALHEAARRSDPETAFFYAHTKGAMSHSAHSTIWRREMTDACVLGYRDCLSALRHGYDVAGAMWIGQRRIFAGNFWWARGAYIAALDAPGDYSRFAAEDWIGTGPARVKDVAPGLPCTRPVTVRMLHHISGGRQEGGDWPAIGGLLTVGEMEAWDLCSVYDDRDPPAYAERVSS